MTLPVPVTFRLPGPEWEPVAPESLGVQNAEFLAVRRNTDPAYAPTITVSGGWRTDPATLDQVADESVARLQHESSDVELLRRRDLGSPQAPAVLQEIGFTAAAEGHSFDLRQVQAIFGLHDVADPARRVVVIHTLTCTFAQLDLVLPEFQAYLATLEVQPDESS